MGKLEKEKAERRKAERRAEEAEAKAKEAEAKGAERSWGAGGVVVQEGARKEEQARDGTGCSKLRTS